MHTRLPLRDRCNTVLRVSTTREPTSTKSKLPATLVSCAGNTPPTASARHSPRFRMSPPPVPSVGPHPLEDIPENGPGGPRQFIPYVFLFSPSSPHQAIPPGGWTHILRILPASAKNPSGTMQVVKPAAGTAQTVRLYTPAQRADNVLPLSTCRILAARDFLALALPYQAAMDAEPPVQPCRADAVRVLLVGPLRALLTVALTYIAFAARCTVVHVMRSVVEEGEDTQACEMLGANARMGLGEREIRCLEWLAREGL
ncbi:hypothetical protein GGX14DRAFT_461235 [Mycena pura]|uniref:Uncharacterized protein n=1 Tax=Mycena pura TaxID=153505 RepID=A0AAD6V9Z3_9AGAR|nr:hypothetical protein GGX14DRAFT_461235 [Mycena pura]